MTRTCGHCRQTYTVRMLTDGAGHLLEDPCPCTERRLRGLCQDCPLPVEGTVGRALRCAGCKAKAARRASAKYRRRNPEKVAKSRRRYEKANREERREWERNHRARPEVRARRNQQRRRRAVQDPSRRAEYARRYKERHPERVREQQERANAKRAAEKREYMRLYATKYTGLDCDPPTCRTCGDEVEYSGVGRPRLDCFDCRPAGQARRSA